MRGAPSIIVPGMQLRFARAQLGVCLLHVAAGVVGVAGVARADPPGSASRIDHVHHDKKNRQFISVKRFYLITHFARNR